MQKSILVVMAIALFAVASCGLDRSPITSEPQVATVTIGPQELTRTEATKDLRLAEIVLTFAVTEAEGGGHDDGHGKAMVGLNAIADTVIGDMRIEFELGSGRHMLRHQMGEWIEHGPAVGDSHVLVRVEDMREEGEGHGHEDTLYADMFYMEVSLEIVRNGSLLGEDHLDPILGHEGFYYGGDFSLQGAGDYDLTVTLGPPTLTRGEATEDKWMSDEMVTFTYQYGGTLDHDEEIGSVITPEGLEVTIAAEPPETLWHFEHGELEEHAPDSSATHHFIVTVRDHSAPVHERMVGYVDVTVGFGDEDAHPVVENACEPMFDVDGFHYGVNMPLTEGGDGDDHGDGEDHGDDGDGGGHDDDDDHGGGGGHDDDNGGGH